MVEKRTTQDLISALLQSAEMGGSGDKPIYRLSDAKKGQSSWSVGVTQIDLGQHKEERKDLQDLLEKSGNFTTKEIAAVMADLPYVPKQSKKMSPDLQAKVNGVLSSPKGKEKVDEWDAKQVRDVSRTVDSARQAARENPQYNRSESFRRQVESDRFIYLVTVNVNQFQNEPRLYAWLRGEPVSAGKKRVDTDGDGKPDPMFLVLGDNIPDQAAFATFEAWSDYLSETPAKDKAAETLIEKAENLKSQHTRWQSATDAAERLGIYTAEEAAQARQSVRDGYSTEEQRKNRADPSKYEIVKGDTFEAIAGKLNVPLDLLKKLNKDLNPAKIKIGDFLSIPDENQVKQWQAEQDAAKKAKEDAQKANGGTPAKPQKGGQKRSDLDPELGGGEITLVSGNMTADPGQVRKTLLGGSMDSPEVTEAQKRDQMLRALYPTMYPEGSSAQQQPAAPTDQGAEQDMTEEERRERRLRMLYPTMYPTTVA